MADTPAAPTRKVLTIVIIAVLSTVGVAYRAWAFIGGERTVGVVYDSHVSGRVSDTWHAPISDEDRASRTTASLSRDHWSDGVGGVQQVAPHNGTLVTGRDDVIVDGDNRAQNRTKVVFMTYMRGGSSLLGEMFNQNPSALYWFEPIDGVYSDLYGTRHGWFPIDILYTSDGKLRSIPKYEEDAIMKHINNLFTCDVTSLPTDLLSHYSMTHLVQRRMGDLADCLTAVNLGEFPENLKYETPSGRVEVPWSCKIRLDNYCHRSFSLETKALYSCWYCLHQENSTSRDAQAAPESNPDCSMARTHLDSYSQCMDNFRQAMQVCLPNLTSTCLQSSIIGFKAIRLRADLIPRLLRDHPDLKVVHQIRDPRGVVYSRRRTALLSELSRQNIVKEASILCQRMAFDIGVLFKLQREFPGRIYLLRYEDLATDPETMARRIYTFLGLPVPPEVTSWLRQSTHAELEGGAYSTVRKNATDTAYKWRHYLTLAETSAITETCKTVLALYKYAT